MLRGFDFAALSVAALGRFFISCEDLLAILEMPISFLYKKPEGKPCKYVCFLPWSFRLWKCSKSFYSFEKNFPD